jgi:hypothetical protein
MLSGGLEHLQFLLGDLKLSPCGVDQILAPPGSFEDPKSALRLMQAKARSVLGVMRGGHRHERQGTEPGRRDQGQKS